MKIKTKSSYQRKKSNLQAWINKRIEANLCIRCGKTRVRKHNGIIRQQCWKCSKVRSKYFKKRKGKRKRVWKYQDAKHES